MLISYHHHFIGRLKMKFDLMLFIVPSKMPSAELNSYNVMLCI